MTLPFWVDLHSLIHSFTELDKAVCDQWSVWLIFCNCGSHSVCPLMDKDKKLLEASWWEGMAVGASGSCSDGWSHSQAILNPIFCLWVGLCSLPAVSPEVKHGRVKGNRDLLQKDLFQDCSKQGPDATAGHCQPMPLSETPGHSEASLAQSLEGSLLLSPGCWWAQGFACALHESVSPVLWKLCNQTPMAFKVKFPSGLSDN